MFYLPYNVPEGSSRIRATSVESGREKPPAGASEVCTAGCPERNHSPRWHRQTSGEPGSLLFRQFPCGRGTE
jgi:hypothetical protein